MIRNACLIRVVGTILELTRIDDYSHFIVIFSTFGQRRVWWFFIILSSTSGNFHIAKISKYRLWKVELIYLGWRCYYVDPLFIYSQVIRVRDVTDVLCKVKELYRRLTFIVQHWTVILNRYCYLTFIYYIN